MPWDAAHGKHEEWSVCQRSRPGCSAKETIEYYKKFTFTVRAGFFKGSDIELSHQEVAETRDINENILIDLNRNGQLVGMTIEHADAHANLSEISFQQLTKKG